MGELKKILTRWQTEIDFNHAWNSFFWEDCGIPRIISHQGNDQEYRVRCVKMFAIVLHLMHGAPYIYDGGEIGMTNCPVKSIAEIEDIESINMYHERLEQRYRKAGLIKSINAKGRDNAGRPIQRPNEKDAGFTSGKPWLKVNPNYQRINVEAALADPGSIFYTYQKLIKLRHEDPVVVDGDFGLVESTGDSVLALWHKLGSEKQLIVTNLSNKRQKFNLDSDFREVLISSYEERASSKNIVLGPYEAFTTKA